MKLTGLLFSMIGCVSVLVQASRTNAQPRFEDIPRFDNGQSGDLNVRVADYLEQVAQYINQNVPAITIDSNADAQRDFFVHIVQNLYLGELRHIYLTHRISWHTLLGPLANALRPHLRRHSLDHLMLAIQYDPAPFVNFLCLIQNNRLVWEVNRRCRELVEDYEGLMAAVHIGRPPVPVPIPIPIHVPTAYSVGEESIPMHQDQDESPSGPIMSTYANLARYGPPAEVSHHVTGYTHHVLLTSLMSIAVYLLL